MNRNLKVVKWMNVSPRGPLSIPGGCFNISPSLDGVLGYIWFKKCEDAVNFRRIKSRGSSKVFLRLLSRSSNPEERVRMIRLRKQARTQKCFIPSSLTRPQRTSMTWNYCKVLAHNFLNRDTYELVLLCLAAPCWVYPHVLIMLPWWAH